MHTQRSVEGYLAVLVFCFLGGRVLAAPPEGYLDAVDSFYVTGWTCDPDPAFQSTAVTVHLYATATNGNGTCFLVAPTPGLPATDRVCYIGGGPADVPREPAVAAACHGTTNHGFRIPTPGYIADGLSHRVYAFAIDPGPTPISNRNLARSGVAPAANYVPFASAPLQVRSNIWTQPSIGAGQLPATLWQPRPPTHSTWCYSRATQAAACGDDPYQAPWNQLKIQPGHISHACPALSTSITWPVGDFTGVYPPAPAPDFQMGHSHTWYGSTAIQAFGTTIGIHNQPASVTSPDEHGWLRGIYAGVNFEPPFSEWLANPQRRYRFTGDIMVANAAKNCHIDPEGNRSAAYVSFVMKFHQRAACHNQIWLNVMLFDYHRDSRWPNDVQCGSPNPPNCFTQEWPDRSVCITPDNPAAGAGSTYPIINAVLSSNATFVSPVGEVYTTSSLTRSPETRAPLFYQFSFDVHGDQLRNAILMAKSKPPPSADSPRMCATCSENPGDWVLDHINLQNELSVIPKSSQDVWMSSAYRDVRVDVVSPGGL